MRKPPRLGKSSLPAPYEVGYGKPPAGTRFRKGMSGNPNGRPKGARNKLPAMNEERLKDIVLAEAYRDIKVNDGDRQITVPMAQAVMRAIAINAAKGQHRSQKLFSDMLHRTEVALKAQHDNWLEKAFEYKVEWERELERRQRLGIVAPEPLPHPDDIEIDMNTGKVILRGPFTKEQKAAWTWLAERRDESDEEIAGLREDLKAAPDARTRRILEEQIRHETGFRDRIVNTIGIWPNRDPMAIHQHRASKERKVLTKRK
ncbi:MAG: DUF5681 domain-containing protein [Beijerinckiaceae bacterium]|nr:DUF5681 domain-containing protein [Brevundimonas sp.]MCZ8302054.1 DUF5681 domain-containing protein [Beijerinckiaceae bacterium]